MFGGGKRAGRARQAESLRRIRDSGVEIGSVIDVGVERKTASLIETFGDRPHLLIEPVAAFHDAISQNYRGIDYRLVGAAAGDRDGVAKISTAAIGKAGISHAWTNRGDGESEAVAMTRIDSAVKNAGLSGPFLLKIDVDSPDTTIAVLDGASAIVSEIACIVCELVSMRVIHTAARIERDGFVLWDLVDIVHYDDVFYQCDGVFLRRDLVGADKRLKPFDFATFNPEKWKVVQ